MYRRASARLEAPGPEGGMDCVVQILCWVVGKAVPWDFGPGGRGGWQVGWQAFLGAGEEGQGSRWGRRVPFLGVRLWRRGITSSVLGSRRGDWVAPSCGVGGGAALEEEGDGCSRRDELDQKRPSCDASRRGLHGGSSEDITGLGSGWLRAGEGLDDP